MSATKKRTVKQARMVDIDGRLRALEDEAYALRGDRGNKSRVARLIQPATSLPISPVVAPALPDTPIGGTGAGVTTPLVYDNASSLSEDDVLFDPWSFADDDMSPVVDDLAFNF